MPPATVHAFTDDVLADHDAVALAGLIRDEELRADEVVSAAIERARTVEPSINAIVVDCFERAMASGPVSSTGAFAGVPTFIKDMNDVEGIATRYGTDALRNARPAENTDAFVQQLFDLGLVCLGKSTMPEFGFTPSTEFPDKDPTRNPWNLAHSAGGSSGGSAALVAAGVVPIAHAADGGGSIRIPAASCGLVGLKPSRGRLTPSQNTKHQIVSIGVEGVVTRSVRDTARIYSEAEKLFHNPKLARIGTVDRPLDRRLRIGAITETAGGDEIDSATRREFESTLELLVSLGHEVEPLPLPVTDQFIEDFSTYWALLGFAVSVGGKRIVNPAFEREELTEFTKGLRRYFRQHLAKAPTAIHRLRRSAASYAALFDERDLVASPTVRELTPPLGYLGMDLPFDILFPRVQRWVSFTPWANATGAPAISLPLGHDEDTNLPVGTMFGARHGEERLLLELALQLEEARPRRTFS